MKIVNLVVAIILSISFIGCSKERASYEDVLKDYCTALQEGNEEKYKELIYPSNIKNSEATEVIGFSNNIKNKKNLFCFHFFTSFSFISGRNPEVYGRFSDRVDNASEDRARFFYQRCSWYGKRLRSRIFRDRNPFRFRRRRRNPFRLWQDVLQRRLRSRRRKEVFR